MENNTENAENYLIENWTEDWIAKNIWTFNDVVIALIDYANQLQNIKTELPNNCNIPVVSNSVCLHKYKQNDVGDLVCVYCEDAIKQTDC